MSTTSVLFLVMLSVWAQTSQCSPLTEFSEQRDEQTTDLFHSSPDGEQTVVHAQVSPLVSLLQRAKRQTHLPMCRYCCNCCRNKRCGYCCPF
ncbi:hepcidin-1 isoform X1 [Erpetoichthys calabaricus]|uniref:hepcidin-1 isoform X1 n=1 Tax=Erpetoichthys calabaricus TaxID=27687 RepID=UPI0010A06278|nr:hepcidin-1 isoform X1 [Erpetoichthys calabaricus]